MHHPTDRLEECSISFVTSCGALVGMRNRTMGSPGGINPCADTTTVPCSTTTVRFVLKNC